ncbi:cell wall metabolism sensor histidine kinase WalK [Methylococcus sp. EFPC2]|uniref:sensor histidine kinase n=1 Tax=Methylococcus sp. EFPC2 TaxID=2812648 RepID=UPI0019678314|nr:HAMP domain-containing sensor histidine kinase [Methylococcus sp. EFPC2]QSA95740.1 HAMP domain-containing histidine kinase [Methylococcus sp. EFPC2]
MRIIPLKIRSFSLRHLLILGFGLAVLPLTLAVVSVVFAVEELAALSRATVDHVAVESRQSRVLLDNLTDLERKGKQYLVLRDVNARAAYEAGHKEFVETVGALKALTAPESLSALLHEFAGEEESLFQSLINAPPSEKPGKRPAARTDTAMKQAADAFQRLRAKASELSLGYSAHVDTEAEELSSRLLSVQQRLLWQASTLAPVGLIVISFFLYVVLRSIRQMDHAIRSLGVGEFAKPIKIRGPRDLEYLGMRLEWLRTRLLELEEAKQRFLRNVSHEIKTPLANLHEGVELLADEVVGELSPEQREIVRIVTHNAERLESLIAELMQYSRINARINMRPPEPVDLHNVVERLIEDYRLQLRAKDVTVRAGLHKLSLVGDEEQLKTAVDNLLSNAVKYSPSGGGIDIGLNDAGDAVELEIEDDGPGIPPDERSKIFEPFYQGSAAREFGVKGSGFGLAIAAECIAAHQGVIWALEPRDGRRGARLRVHLPKYPSRT